MGVKVLVTSMIKLTECSVLITKAFMTSSWNTKPLPFSLAVRAKDLWWWGACRERTCDGGAWAEKDLVMVGCEQRKILWWWGACRERTCDSGVHGGNVSCWDLLEDSGAFSNHPPPPPPPHLSLSDGSDAHQYHHPENEPRGYMYWCRFGADMHKLHPSVLQWLDRDSNYLTERWSCHSLCRWKQVRTVWQLVNWITHSWLELTFPQATDTKIQYTQCSGQSKLHRYQTFLPPPEDIYHALSIRMILAQETQPFHRSRWFESSASSCIRWRKSAGNGWKVCLALYSVRTSQVSLEWICLAPELACSLEWMRLCWTLDPICFSLLSL